MYQINSSAVIKGYITNLGRYNEGILSGRWISFPISEDELNAVLGEIGCYYINDDGEPENEDYEEFFFSEWESELETGLGEYVNIDDVNDIAESIEALDDYDRAVFEAYIEATGESLTDALDCYDDCVFFNGMTMLDVAYEIADEYLSNKSIPDFVRNYFDYDAFARDLSFDGYYETSGGVICIC